MEQEFLMLFLVAFLVVWVSLNLIKSMVGERYLVYAADNTVIQKISALLWVVLTLPFNIIKWCLAIFLALAAGTVMLFAGPLVLGLAVLVALPFVVFAPVIAIVLVCIFSVVFIFRVK